MTTDELIESFARPASGAHAARLLVTAGLPGSGKSHLARALAAGVPGLAIVEADAVRRTLTGGAATYAPEEHALVHRSVIALARRLLDEGYAVIADATNLKRRERRWYLEAANGKPTAVAWCAASADVVRARLAGRLNGANPLDVSEAGIEVYERMAGRGSIPDASEADLVVTVTPESLDAGVSTLRDWFATA